MTNQTPQSTFDEKLKAEIKYRVEQEYEKYHNDLTTDINGKDFWIEQITWKLADTITSLVLEEKANPIAQTILNLKANYDLEYTKRELSSDNLPKGYRKMTDKEFIYKALNDEFIKAFPAQQRSIITKEK